jgi:hypothetical protein
MGGTAVSAAATSDVAPAWPTGGEGRLGADLAPAPWPLAADGGDVRAVIMGLASVPPIGRDIAGDPPPSAAAGTALAEGDELDFTAAALYGPPDRQPQATQEALLEEGALDGRRGRARGYLEDTASSRFLVPSRD